MNESIKKEEDTTPLVPPTPWVLTDGEDSLSVVDANGDDIISVSGIGDRPALGWIDHMVECVNICHAAKEATEKETKPNVITANGLKGLILGDMKGN